MRLLVNHRIFEDRNPNKKRNMLRHIFLRRQQLTAQEPITLQCLNLDLFALKFVMIAKIHCANSTIMKNGISGWENLGAFFW